MFRYELQELLRAMIDVITDKLLAILSTEAWQECKGEEVIMFYGLGTNQLIATEVSKRVDQIKDVQDYLFRGPVKHRRKFKNMNKSAYVVFLHWDSI